MGGILLTACYIHKPARSALIPYWGISETSQNLNLSPIIVIFSYLAVCTGIDVVPCVACARLCESVFAVSGLSAPFWCSSPDGRGLRFAPTCPRNTRNKSKISPCHISVVLGVANSWGVSILYAYMPKKQAVFPYVLLCLAM